MSFIIIIHNVNNKMAYFMHIVHSCRLKMLAFVFLQYHSKSLPIAHPSYDSCVNHSKRKYVVQTTKSDEISFQVLFTQKQSLFKNSRAKILPHSLAFAVVLGGHLKYHCNITCYLVYFQNVYGNLACNEWDRRYVQSVVNRVMRGVVESRDGVLKLGKLEVPLPPSNIRKEIILLFRFVCSFSVPVAECFCVWNRNYGKGMLRM